MEQPTDKLIDLCAEGLMAVASDNSIRALNQSMTQMLGAWGDSICRVEDLPLGDAFLERWSDRGKQGFDGRFELAGSGGGFVGVRVRPHAEHEWVLVCANETAIVALHEELHRLRRLRNLSAMVRGIVHDFNNVLGSIIGFSDHLAQSALTEDSRFFFEHMQVSASKGAALVRVVTDYMLKTDCALERTDLGALVDEVFLLVEKTAVLVGAELSREPMPEPVSVWSTQGSMLELVSQVLLHYIGTAPASDTEIELRTGREGYLGREFGFVEMQASGDPHLDVFLCRLIEQPETGLQASAAAMPSCGDLLLDALVGLRLGGGEIRCSAVGGRRSVWIGYPVARSGR